MCSRALDFSFDGFKPRDPKHSRLSLTLRPRHTMRQIAATRRGDTSPRLPCFCDKSLALSLSLRYVARIQTSLNSCDRSQRQNSVAATMIFTCHTRRFVAATCRGDVSQRFVASCVSAFNCFARIRKNTLPVSVVCSNSDSGISSSCKSPQFLESLYIF